MASRKKKKEPGALPPKMGRPPIEINWDTFEQLMRLGLTLREASWFFECSEDTIENKVLETKGVTFSEYRAQRHTTLQVSLRRKIIEKALVEGDNTMLIWASKNIMKWADKVEQKQEIEHNVVYKTNFGDADDEEI